MAKFFLPVAAMSLLVVLNGCGGSGSSSKSGNVPGGESNSMFVATLPDGSQMALEVFNNSNGTWTGDFAVAAETGPYAFQTGAFEGSIDGSAVEATCEIGDGTEFQLTGTVNRDGSLDLTRSDIPGQTLHFVLSTETPSTSQPSRADLSFKINTEHDSGRATVSDKPVHNLSGVKAYDGKWNGTPIRMWAYDSGRATLYIYLDDRFISTTTLSKYRLSDFPTATVRGTSEILYDCKNPNARFTFTSSLTVSPP